MNTEEIKAIKFFANVLKASFKMELPLDEDQLRRDFIDTVIDETVERFDGGN